MSTRELVRSDAKLLATLASRRTSSRYLCLANTLEDYRQGKAENTLAHQHDDTALFRHIWLEPGYTYCWDDQRSIPLGGHIDAQNILHRTL
jgi:hypothetical protein